MRARHAASIKIVALEITAPKKELVLLHIASDNNGEYIIVRGAHFDIRALQIDMLRECTVRLHFKIPP